MALLHYALRHASTYGITICALTCDHGLRGEASKADVKFVQDYCAANGVPVLSFARTGVKDKSEASARKWRLSCYAQAIKEQTLSDGSLWQSADAVATAHHADDNAETVLFHLSRGCSLAGAVGITDTQIGGVSLIRPLIAATRAEIDDYIAQNGVPYVIDATNADNDYTRNKLRHNVLPALADAVPEAVSAMYRFSRMAEETEAYFADLIANQKVITPVEGGYFIKNTQEKAVFTRAARTVMMRLGKADYTYEHLAALYDLQFAERGKKFEFLGLTAYCEEGGLAVFLPTMADLSQEMNFFTFINGQEQNFYGVSLCYANKPQNLTGKVLRFDVNAVPQDAVLRFARTGDTFTKFGGGSKKLGDYFTDKKISVRLRGRIPVLAAGNQILMVCGVEIADQIKVTSQTKEVGYILCQDYCKKGE